MFNHPYICIDTDYEIPDESIICWMRCVQEAGPAGILSSTETMPNGPQMSFYKRQNGNTMHHVAALARNLSSEEATNIAKRYSDLNPDGDFMIHWSQEPMHDNSGERLADDLRKVIALEAAKLNHNKWVQQRVNEGWRYATLCNERNKTSPMCKDWDSLPDSYKQGELERMVSLFEILEKMNLMITRK